MTPYYKWAYGKFTLVGYLKESDDKSRKNTSLVSKK